VSAGSGRFDLSFPANGKSIGDSPVIGGWFPQLKAQDVGSLFCSATKLVRSPLEASIELKYSPVRPAESIVRGSMAFTTARAIDLDRLNDFRRE